MMKVLMVVLLLLLGGSLFVAEAKYMVYNTSQGIVKDKINVHLVAHTHDDVGWLKTVDQYYVGSNNSIQGACVQNVLDSLIPALLADRNRKFIYAFFQRWWRDQSETMQHVVKQLVSSGQLEFINGGMCMHDEAVTHYIDMIDQTTLGHRFIKKDFGVTPRIGWQIDPFGHSAVQAYLLGAEIGFDSLFFGRIDYQDRAKRKNEKSLEVVWQGSKSFGSSAQIFAGAFPENYEPPPGGFYYEVNDPSPVVQDDINLFDYNVQERVDAFVTAAVSQANITRTNHIMWTMGTDFKYQYAHSWFRQMDKLIHYVNMDGRVNALYSTPSIYTDAKHATNEHWPVKTEDFFPYADHANGYWTGYYTSRPALKRYVRMMSGYYLAARQLEFYNGRSNTGPNTDSLADSLAIAQHHDGVTGTEKQHVANDYAKRLSIGYTECPLLNISYCPASEVDLSQGRNLIVVVYNSLGWARDDVIQFPVLDENVTVHDSEKREILSQIIPIADAFTGLRNSHVNAYLGRTPAETPKYWLAFTVSVPPFGFSTYSISSAKRAGARSSKSSVYTFRSEKSTVEVGQGNLMLTFSAKKDANYVNNRSSVKESVEQSFSFYSGYNGTGNDKDPQNSGAYIFRPNGTSPIKPKSQVPLTVMRGPVLDEVHQQVSEWIYQITRLYKGREHVEVEFIVGPIPVEDGIGKEVATQITTTMETNKTFYTDSNGRDFIKRIRDYRTDWDLEVNQPSAGNYYPINLGIYFQDDKKEFSVLVDRALGGSSLVDGQIELMLHRRLLLDDSRGVAEALNETVCVLDQCKGLTIQGKYYFRIDPIGEGAKWRRSFGQEIYSPLLLAFSEEDGDKWMNTHVTTFSSFDSSYSLPDNVAVLTLQELDDGKVLLRLAHLYEIGKAAEMSLSANQERAEMEKKRLVWKAEGSSRKQAVLRGGPVDPAKLVVELAPMEIRTFVIDFDDKGHHVFAA
uniref:Alpha-mannosidase n=1 Tax=Salix viminalis TaxID=40686 RepID=A0A6N2M9Q3_SALVM